MFKNKIDISSYKIGPIKVADYLNKSVARNIIYMSLAILLFISGVVIYGIVLNLREVPFSEAMMVAGYDKLTNVSLLIDRNKYTLSLMEGETIIKDYRASFGKNLNKPKNRAGDGATPVGEYIICSIDTSHNYHKFFKLNYPNLSDATDALKLGWISQKEFNDIKFEFYYNRCISYNTILGGNIGIHGIGRLNYIFKNLPFVFNWTDGSVALSNENIDEIYSIIKIGTKVVIK